MAEAQGAGSTRERASDGERITYERPAAGWIELTAPSRNEFCERISGLLDRLASARLGSEVREDIRAAVSEIVSNAMEWGNRGDAGRRVHVSYGFFGNEVVFKVEDEGAGFSPEDVPDASSRPAEVARERKRAGKRLGGLGIFVARKLMDRIMYSDRGNVVLLAKRIAPAGKA